MTGVDNLFTSDMHLSDDQDIKDLNLRWRNVTYVLIFLLSNQPYHMAEVNMISNFSSAQMPLSLYSMNFMCTYNFIEQSV